MPQSAEFDVLAFWKERSRRSRNPARMACDILSIPITTVESEYAFSIGARVVKKYRSSMKDDSVQALLCARSWLHGFEGMVFKVLSFLQWFYSLYMLLFNGFYQKNATVWSCFYTLFIFESYMHTVVKVATIVKESVASTV